MAHSQLSSIERRLTIEGADGGLRPASMKATRPSATDIYSIPTGEGWRIPLLEAWRNMPDLNGNNDESMSQSHSMSGLKARVCVIS
jgi:hypothetical protein